MPPHPEPKTSTEKFRADVAYLIRRLIDLNLELENHKRDLFQNHMFSPFVAFQYLDIYGQGYITQKDFESLMKKNNIDATSEEIQYLMFQKGKEDSFDVDFTLTRPDTICYKSFLNIIAPKDISILKNKFCDLTGKYEGKERLLPAYVFKHLLHVLKLEIEKFREIETMKNKYVRIYGYFAHSAFKSISQSSETIDYTNLSRFMVTNGYSMEPKEYKSLLWEVDSDFDERIDKSEFLDFLTPFNSYLTSYVGERRYEDLGKLNNQEHFEKFMENSFRPKKKEEKKGLDDDRHKRVPEMLKGIYTEQFKDPKHPVNRHLFVDDKYKVNFNLRKKRFDPTTTRGFNDYYNNYFKQLCHGERKEAVNLARKIVDREKKAERPKENFFGNYLGKKERDTNMNFRRFVNHGSRGNILDRFDKKFMSDRKKINKFHNATFDRFKNIIGNNHGVNNNFGNANEIGHFDDDGDDDESGFVSYNN